MVTSNAESYETIAQLIAALEPFAEYAIQQESSWTQRDNCVFYGVKRDGAKQVTYGDWRNAAAAWRRVKSYQQRKD